MITELEKQFFDTFGIEPKEPIFKTMNCACGCHDCENCEKYKNNFSKTYPQITDRHYLGLLAILNKKSFFIGTTIDELKEEALNDSIVYHLSIKEEVRALFKEL